MNTVLSVNPPRRAWLRDIPFFAQVTGLQAAGLDPGLPCPQHRAHPSHCPSHLSGPGLVVEFLQLEQMGAEFCGPHPRPGQAPGPRRWSRFRALLPCNPSEHAEKEVWGQGAPPSWLSSSPLAQGMAGGCASVAGRGGKAISKSCAIGSAWHCPHPEGDVLTPTPPRNSEPGAGHRRRPPGELGFRLQGPLYLLLHCLGWVIWSPFEPGFFDLKKK